LGAEAESGISSLDRDAVPSHGDDLALTDQGSNRKEQR
jgi:hypothetical protein